MTRDEAIRKAAALLRLAERGGTVGEAGAAAARAQALIEKFELDRAGLGEVTAQDAEEAIDNFGERPSGWLDSMKWMEMWKGQLAMGVARANDCFVWRSHRGQGAALEIVGRPSQVELVRSLYGFLVGEIEHLCAVHGRGMGAVWRREFKEGAAREVGVILKEERAKTMAASRALYSADKMALVRVETALAKMDGGRAAEMVARRKLQLRSGGRRYVQNDQSARQAGAAAARTINMSGHGTKRIGD